MLVAGIFLFGLLLIFYPYIVVLGMYLARRWGEWRDSKKESIPSASVALWDDRPAREDLDWVLKHRRDENFYSVSLADGLVIDQRKYRGRGRPRKSDYISVCETLRQMNTWMNRHIEHKHSKVGSPRYSSKHSIDVNGSCNMGCC